MLAIADYDGHVRDLITAWKERGHRALAPTLAEALAEALASVAVHDALGHRRRVHGRTAAVGRILVVPMPTSRASRRRRGEDAWGRVVAMAVRQATATTRQAADSAASSSGGLHLERCLTFTRQPADQAGLSARERSRNLSGAMACRGAPPPGAIVLVDDVVTTGATLAEAARCLIGAGGDVRLALTLAATRRSGGSRGSRLSP